MHRSNVRSSLLLGTLLAGVLTTACDDGVGVEPTANAGTSTVRVLLTDAPADYIAAAEVDIGRVELLPADGGPAIVLSDDGTDGFVNLLDFQNAATTPLAEADVDAGAYHQLRLFVDSARVELIAGYTFRDGSTVKDLKVPSGAQTGIKLNLHSADDDGPLEIVPGETVLVLDFDVNRSFVLLGNPETPAGVHGVNFKPTIKVTGYDVAASLSGTVSTQLDGVSVEGLVVTATPTDGGTVEGYQSQAGTAITDDTGAYTVYFLVPGSYDVTVELGDPTLATTPTSAAVMLADGQDATGIDFEIIDVSGSISGTVATVVASTTVDGLTVTAVSATDTLVTTVQADSTYSFGGVLPGDYTVTLSVGADRIADPDHLDVTVNAGQDVTGVDFEILEDLSGSISGTVTTSAGATVGGLTVTATPATPGVTPATTTTAVNGAYSFPSLPADDYVVTVTVAAGFATNPASLAIELLADEVETGADFDIVAAP